LAQEGGETMARLWVECQMADGSSRPYREIRAQELVVALLGEMVALSPRMATFALELDNDEGDVVVIEVPYSPQTHKGVPAQADGLTAWISRDESDRGKSVSTL
jgi:hypothetical protein